MSNVNTLTRQSIAAAIARDKKGVIAVLKKNGISISSDYSDRDVITAVLVAVKNSSRFRKEFAEYLADAINSKKIGFTGEGMFGFTGENMFRLSGVHPPNGWMGADGDSGTFSGLDQYFTTTPGPSSTTTTPTDTPKTKSGNSTLSTLFSGQNLSNLLNSGLGILSTTLSNKSNKELADTALEIEQEKTKQAALAAASGQTIPGAKKPLSTSAKVGIVLGVVALAGLLTWGIIRLAKRKK